MNRRRQMMLKKSSGGLPDGFTAVNYLQSTGTQYIDTGRKLTQDSDITIDFMIVDKLDSDAGIFGSRESATKNNLALFKQRSDRLFVGDFSKYPKYRFMTASSLNTPGWNRQYDRASPTPLPLKSYTLSASPTPSV